MAPITLHRQRALIATLSILSYSSICNKFLVGYALVDGFRLQHYGTTKRVHWDEQVKRSRHEYEKIVSRQSKTRYALRMAAEDDIAEEDKPHRVCILGGGFAGVNTALTLASLANEGGTQGGENSFLPSLLPTNSNTLSKKKKKIEVTLLDPKDRFVFLPLLYELCVGDATEDEVAPTYQSLFERETNGLVKHKRGEVAGIDAKNKCVFYKRPFKDSSMNQQFYDSLIVCTGLKANPHIVPGASEHATCFHTLDDCYTLRDQLNSLIEEATRNKSNEVNVVVVGGGYSGVELALNVKEFVMKGLDADTTKNDKSNKSNVAINVSLIQKSDDILKNSSEFNRQSAKDLLQKCKIKVRTNSKVKKVSPSDGKDEEDVQTNSLPRRHKPCAVELEVQSPDSGNSTSEIINADLLLWTAGAAPSEETGVLKSLLARDEKGRIVTTNTLQVSNFPDVYALGDCATIVKPNETNDPPTAQKAIQQAPIVAWNVWADIENASKGISFHTPKLPFNYASLGEMMTLGSDEATISSLGGLIELKGPVASVARRAIYGVRMPTNTQRIQALRDSSTKRLESLSKQVAAATKK